MMKGVGSMAVGASAITEKSYCSSQADDINDGQVGIANPENDEEMHYDLPGLQETSSKHQKSADAISQASASLGNIDIDS
jgi:hypothetical protein